MSVVKRQKIETPNGIISNDASGGPQGKVLYSNSVYLEGGHEGPVYTGQFSKQGNYIASGGHDKFINIWKLPTVEDESVNLWCSQAHKNAVTCVRWMEDDYGLASGSADSTISLWDSKTGEKVRNYKNNSIINEIDSFRSNILSADDNGDVKLWDPKQKNPISIVEQKYPILTCTFNNKGTNIYFSGIDPSIFAYDVRRLDQPLWKCAGPIDSISSISINSDDSMLVSRSISGSVNIYNAKDFVPESTNRLGPFNYEGAPSNGEYRLIRSCFSNDNINIISGSDDKTVTVWDVNSRRVRNKFAGHEGSVLDVAYHPTEKIILSTALDGSIVIREV